jgi:hypothetical protein
LKSQQHHDQKKDQIFEEEIGEEDGDGARVHAPLMVQNGSDAEEDELTRNSHSEKFVNDICRRPSGILPVPDNITQRQQPPRSTFGSAPRRSRRVAGIGVEFQMQDLGSRSTKRAMRTLQIITEYEGKLAQKQSKNIKNSSLILCLNVILKPFQPCLVGTLRLI